MLHLIGTLDRPSPGTVRIDGHDVARSADRQLSALRARRIGFVFQQFHLAAGRDALSTTWPTGCSTPACRAKERRRRAEAALVRVGLGDRLEHRPHQLSGGERQRVAIARAVVGEPALLLADEPTGNLDSVSGAGVMDLLRELHADGTTVLVITHDREIADEPAAAGPDARRPGDLSGHPDTRPAAHLATCCGSAGPACGPGRCARSSPRWASRSASRR